MTLYTFTAQSAHQSTECYINLICNVLEKSLKIVYNSQMYEKDQSVRIIIIVTYIMYAKYKEKSIIIIIMGRHISLYYRKHSLHDFIY